MYSPIVLLSYARVFVLSATNLYFGDSIPAVIDAYCKPASRWTVNDRTSITAGISYFPPKTSRGQAMNLPPALSNATCKEVINA